MCPKLLLLSMHTHTRPQGSPWCDKPDKKLEKNLDPPIINPIIRDSSLIFTAKSNLSNRAIKVGMQAPLIGLITLGIRGNQKWLLIGPLLHFFTYIDK